MARDASSVTTEFTECVGVQERAQWRRTCLLGKLFVSVCFSAFLLFIYRQVSSGCTINTLQSCHRHNFRISHCKVPISKFYDDQDRISKPTSRLFVCGG